LIPDFDGAVFSWKWKEQYGCGQVLHGSATTTEASVEQYKNSQESLKGLGEALRHQPENGRQVEKAYSVGDLPTGPKEPKSTVLTEEEETSLLPSNGNTLLTLDDCLCAPTDESRADTLVSASLPTASRYLPTARGRG